MEFTKRNLLEDSENDSEPDHRLTINEHYAKAFEYRKEREELSKLKEKYGSDAELGDDNEDSESDESEDEDGDELTPAIDAAILRTLSKIRQKDPTIYDNAKDVFEEEKARVSASTPWGYRPSKNKPKDKPVTFKQLNLQSLLESGARSQSPESSRPTYVEEQAALRSEAIAAFHEAVPSASGVGEEGEIAAGILTLREKTKDELEKEEEEYRAYLEREVGDVKKIVQLDADAAGDGTTSVPSSSAAVPAEGSTRTSANDGEQSNHEFLINYIVNRGWIDRDSRHLPTYDEVTAPRRKNISNIDPEVREANDKGTLEFNAETGETVPDLDELEEFEDVADHFESTFNFRFEEPGAQAIHRHARNIGSTVRRENTTRKEARERKKTRKQEEIAQRKEEIQRLKALKMRELKKKFALVSKESGLADEALEELDLEGDWDPSKHDAQMAALYTEEISGDAEDLEKPVWEDEIDISDIVPSERKSKKQKKKEERRKAKAEGVTAEQGEGIDVDMMDADVVGISNASQDDEEWDGTEEMRKRKVAEYMDSVYGMEFNDIIGGDLPTRFKYTSVEKSGFNLSAAEILMATNAELNEYMGMKKLVPYKKGRQPWDAKRSERLRELKQKIRQRFGEVSWRHEVGREWGVKGNSGEKRGGDGEEGGKRKKRRGKRERMKERDQAMQAAEAEGARPSEDTKAAQASQDENPKMGTLDAAEDDEDVTKKDSRRKKKRRRRTDNE